MSRIKKILFLIAVFVITLWVGVTMHAYNRTKPRKITAFIDEEKIITSRAIRHYSKIYEHKKLKKLMQRLDKSCQRHLNLFTSVYISMIGASIDFLVKNKIHVVFTDGSALALERFGLLASPWDDDVDVGYIELDVALELVSPNANIHPAYIDISSSSKGERARSHYCELEVHKKACVGFKLFQFAYENTNDCISFELLNWGFYQVRYHPRCKPKGEKTFDLWINYKCKNEESTKCKEASIIFESYIRNTKGLQKGERSKNGLKREGVDLTMGDFEMRMLPLGLLVPVLKENQHYLSTIYGGEDVWKDEVVVCPHDTYASFGSCVGRAGRFPMSTVLLAMSKVPACNAIMKNATAVYL